MQRFIFAVLLAIITFGVLSKARDGGLVWSDLQTLGSVQSKDGRWVAFGKAWSEPRNSLYTPLPTTVWALIWDSDARGNNLSAVEQTKPFELETQDNLRQLHTINLFFHIGTSILVFLILCTVIGVPFAAFVGSVLFAAHPLQVEPVAWISGLPFLMGGFFSALTIYCYLIYSRESVALSRSNAKKSRRTLYLMGLAYLAALLSAPWTVVTPIVAFVAARLLPKDSSFARTSAPSWPIVLGLLLALPVAIATIYFQDANTVDDAYHVWARPPNCGRRFSILPL